MPPGAAGLVLLAALLHASWNLLLKTSGDRLVAAAIQSAAGAAVLAPILVAGGYPGDRWGALLGSAACHLGYGLTLVAAYGRGDLSLVYPVARGSAPLVVALGAAVLLDDRPGAAAVFGIVLVAGGILAVAGRRRAGLGWAVVCGLCIAGYTLVDGAAVRAAGSSPRYTAALFLSNAITIGMVALVRRSRGDWVAGWRASGWRQVGGGMASALAYLLVLTAARSAPLGAVAALREISVVLAAIAGWRVLGEPFGRRRVVAAGVIAVGAILLVV